MAQACCVCRFLHDLHAGDFDHGPSPYLICKCGTVGNSAAASFAVPYWQILLHVCVHFVLKLQALACGPFVSISTVIKQQSLHVLVQSTERCVRTGGGAGAQTGVDCEKRGGVLGGESGGRRAAD